MNNQRGYYSLIQFCPDQSRLEGVNVGVVLYSPADQKLEVLVAPDNRRIRKFFGNRDWDFVNRAKASIEHQLRLQSFHTVSDLADYIARRANVIQLTPLRPMRITSICADARALYLRLVGRDPIERRRRIDGILTKRLIEAGVDGLVRKSVSVKIPSFNRAIHAPYGYQNGRFNLITPVLFDPEAGDILAKTGKSAIEGQMLYRHSDPDLGEMRLVVIAKFTDRVENSDRDFVRRTFEEHSVKLHTFEDFDPLVDDIRRSARLHNSAQLLH
jgi:hypothetical protein